MTKTAPTLLIAAAAALTCAPGLRAEAPIPAPAALFNGTDLSGWTQRGGEATYAVEDGKIVGTTVPNTPNSFLCTEEEYGDFVLEFEFKVDRELNSGCMIRAQEYEDGMPWPAGARKGTPGRVCGYQIEIDPAARGWSGGLYDEARRGWLDDHSDKLDARYAFRQGDWNHYRIVAIGPHIRTWINGVPGADYLDTADLSGFLGLQVHGVGKREDPLEVEFREITLTDLGESSWQPLFNGRDLDGWSCDVEGAWTVEDGGILRGRSSKDQPRHAILAHEDPLGDFAARIVYRANAGNSGLYFRSEKVDSNVAVHGFQAEIDARGNDVGGIYETGGRSWVSQPSAELTEKVYKKEDWNEMTVCAYGGRVAVHVNGVLTTLLEDDPGRLEGVLGLQLHGSQDMDIEVKSVEVLQLGENSTAWLAADDFEPAVYPARDPIAPQSGEIKKLADGFKFTEGPAMSPDGRVFFTDIPNERIHIYDPETGNVTVFTENSGSSNGLMFAPGGSLLACEMLGRQLSVYPDADTPEKSSLVQNSGGKRLNQLNDLALDGRQGVFFTDPIYKPLDDRQQGLEGVYYLPRGAEEATRIDDLCTKPNGIALTPDGRTLYVVDNGAKEMIAYDVEGSGYNCTVSNRRVLCPLPSEKERAGDGMDLDEFGNLYVTTPEGIRVFDPEGTQLLLIELPEAPANCKFGHGEHRQTLFVTARTGLYSVEMNVAGTRRAR